MHEAKLARGILREALARATLEGTGRVVAVRGRLAETETISRESLALSFAALAAGTAAEGARLELAIEHVRARCRACGADYLPDHHLLLCPRCGDADGELLGRTGLFVEAIEVET